MASSSTEICNLALRHIGISKEIASVETEKSTEAGACRRFYSDVLDEVLRDFAWPFACRITTLALVAEDPNDEWGYSYREPSGCLRFIRILSGIRNEYKAARVPYKKSSDDTGILIFTDTQSAKCEYIARVTNVLIYPPDFTMAFSMKLAAYIAPSVTGGDPFRLRDSTLKLYEEAISKAKSNSSNEQEPDDSPDSEFIRERN